MDDMKEFVAFSRKLLRSLTSIEKELSNGNTDHALELLRELIEDTKKDIEA